MTLFTKTALVAPFFLLVSACNNEIEIDPVVGEYALDLFEDVSLPVNETQVQVGAGSTILCDVERDGVVSFSNNLDFSLSVRERIFNCTDFTFNEDESVILLGSGSVLEVGSTYSVLVEIDNSQVTLDCNLQDDNLFCQGFSGTTGTEFQATRVE